MPPPSSPASSRPEKQMSSRLMTMKFMQRAAASATPGASTTSTPNSNDGRPDKRRRTGDYASNPQTPSSQPSTPRPSELNAITAALAAEEQKRTQALAKHGIVVGETQWVLNLPGATNGTTNGASKGHSAEHSDSDDSDSVVVGRQSFGAFKRKRQSVTAKTDGDSASAESEEGETSSSGPLSEEENSYRDSRREAQHKKSRDRGLEKRQQDYEKNLDSMKHWKGSGQISGGKSKASPNTASGREKGGYGKAFVGLSGKMRRQH